MRAAGLKPPKRELDLSPFKSRMKDIEYASRGALYCEAGGGRRIDSEAPFEITLNEIKDLVLTVESQRAEITSFRQVERQRGRYIDHLKERLCSHGDRRLLS